jgi:hypothetical protein
MNTKHTPGPWEIDREFIRNAEGQMIAEVQRYHYLEIQLPDGTLDVGSEEMPYKANARLMAAAPELIEILEDLLLYGDGESMGYHEARHSAEKLLAKIEGDEH